MENYKRDKYLNLVVLVPLISGPSLLSRVVLISVCSEV